jgi:hypothetical protein
VSAHVLLECEGQPRPVDRGLSQELRPSATARKAESTLSSSRTICE